MKPLTKTEFEKLLTKKKLTKEESDQYWNYTTKMSDKERWELNLKRGIMARIDPLVRILVKELNARGFYTGDSCSGHKKRGKSWKRGMIFIKHKYVKDPEVRAILQKHGARNISREKYYGDESAYWVYSFDAME